jgi:hypothetical protein
VIMVSQPQAVTDVILDALAATVAPEGTTWCDAVLDVGGIRK